MGKLPRHVPPVANTGLELRVERAAIVRRPFSPETNVAF
jgi:hypothetical protein